MIQENRLLIQLSDFDGPLDLLVNLIKDHKLNILDLDIALLTEQYLNFINNAIDLITVDQAGEYLSMACYLVELKSKKVLPNLNEVVLEGDAFELERDKLTQRLLEYSAYKSRINDFREKSKIRMNHYDKEADDIEEIVGSILPEEKLPESINANRLSNAIINAYNRLKDRMVFQQKVTVYEISIDDVLKELEEFYNKNPINETTFYDLLSLLNRNCLNIQFLVAFFGAILELAKYGRLKLQQVNDKEIIIAYNKDYKGLEE